MNNIRNFVIIAHIDHGKSTLADRLLEVTGTVPMRSMKPQFLDQLESERERGITIKMAPVRMRYTNPHLNPPPLREGGNKAEFILNLIDTPGHSDFGYEVSRALMAVEGAILLVDATQGIQAQTIANFEQAKRAGLAIIGAVNKVDMAAPEQVEAALIELGSLLGVSENEILKVSGKTGEGVADLLRTVVLKVPPPQKHPDHGDDGNEDGRALIFDSKYDEHKGIIAFVRVFNGRFVVLGKDDAPYNLLAMRESFKPKEVGFFAPQLRPAEVINAGEIGYIATGIKDPDKLKIGDTIASSVSAKPLPGFREPKPVVFVSFYPAESDEFDELKSALGRLRLNDSSIQYEPDSSEVLGRGFKAGFLGQLHFEIAAERLLKEFKLETVHSFPSVAYEVKTHEGWNTIKNPKDFPADPAEVLEPIAKVEILVPGEYLGAVLGLSQFFRFREIETRNFGGRMLVSLKMPLADLIRDFDDQLKSGTQGFASLSYEIIGNEKADVKKMEIHVAGHSVPGLARIVPREDLEREGRKMVERLKDLLPKEQFSQALQAVVDGRIIARETIPAMKKLLGNFGKTGGDRTRKMKLWKKQKEGKQKLKEIAEKSQIKIPAGVFKELLKK
jgi:GTP-binding protein LepA